MQTQNPIWALTLARLREFTRQPEALFWVYFFPVLMVLVLGVAFRNKPQETIAIDVLQNDFSESVTSHLEESKTFKITVVDEQESKQRLRTGKTLLLITANDASLQSIDYQFDPARPGSTMARNDVDQTLQRAAGREDVIATTNVEFQEPGGRYVDFLVPGLLAMGLMGGGLWGVGFAIVDMRIRKVLKRFMATPMKRTHFLIAMMCSRLVFMWPQIIILLVFSYFVFGVQIYGNWLSIALIILLGAIQFAGIGLLVASRAKTLETVSGLMNLVMLPMWTLCGIFFSYENFPEIFHPFIRWLPLTPIIDALRALMNEGRSITTLWFELGVMAVWAVVPFFVALLIFRWND
ncbi:MAG: ABC transporter permease [Planctomycetota bacterium]